MQRFPEDWDLKTRIEFLQRKIIVLSVAYYDFNVGLTSDRSYDEICRQLVDMQKEYGKDDSYYYYVYYDFSAETGFHLFDRLTLDDKKRIWKIAELCVHPRISAIQEYKIQREGE